jgi:hypothetical protein
MYEIKIKQGYSSEITLKFKTQAELFELMVILLDQMKLESIRIIEIKLVKNEIE